MMFEPNAKPQNPYSSSSNTSHVPQPNQQGARRSRVHHRAVHKPLRHTLITFFSLVCSLLVSCSGSGSAPGRVTITYPTGQITVYAELLYVSGTSDRANSAFNLMLRRADGGIQAQTRITTDTNGDWSVELAHGYRSEPAAFDLLTFPIGDPTTAETPQPYTSTTITIAASAQRPYGAFATIDPIPQPSGNQTVQISGTASGIAQNTFTLLLLDPNQTLITQKTVTFTNPYLIDQTYWSAEFTAADLTQAASLRLVTVDPNNADEVILAEQILTPNQ